MSNSGIDHCADAGPAVAQRDIPQPAVGLRLYENIAFIRGFQPTTPGKISVHGQVPEKIVPLSQSQLAGYNAPLSACVHHPGSNRLSIPLGTIGGSMAHTDRPARGIQRDSGRLLTLQHPNPVTSGVIQENLVELRPPHLVRMWIANVCLAEIPAPGLRVGTPNHGGATLANKTGLLHFIQNAQVLQYRYAGRQQRFTHVVPWEPIAFQQQDAVTAPGQQRAYAGAGRAAADYNYRVRICQLELSVSKAAQPT